MLKIFYYVATSVCIGAFHLLPEFFSLNGVEAKILFNIFFVVAVSGLIVGTYLKNEMIAFASSYLLCWLLYVDARGMYWWYGHHIRW